MADYTGELDIRMLKEDAIFLESIVIFMDEQKNRARKLRQHMNPELFDFLSEKLDALASSFSRTLKSGVSEIVLETLTWAINENLPFPVFRSYVDFSCYNMPQKKFYSIWGGNIRGMEEMPVAIDDPTLGHKIVHDDPGFNAEIVANIARIAVVQFGLPSQVFSFNEPCVDEGNGGGVVIVTRDGIFRHTLRDILEEEKNKVEQKHPLSFSVADGRIDLVKKHLQDGENIDEEEGQPLRWAMTYGNKAIVEYLLRRGARVDWPDLPNVEKSYPEIARIIEREILSRAAMVTASEKTMPRISRHATL